MSLLVITHHDSYKYAFKSFSISTRGCCRFLVIERFGDVHKLVVVCFVLADDRDFILGILVFFLNLVIQHVCLSNLTTAPPTP